MRIEVPVQIAGVPLPATDSRTRFLDLLTASLEDGTFVRLTLSSPVDTSAEADRRWLVRWVELKEGRRLQFTRRQARKDTAENLSPEEGCSRVRAALGGSFRSALLATTRRDWQVHVAADGSSRIQGHRPARAAAPERSHDLPSSRLLDPKRAPFLRELGVTDASGAVRPRMGDKFRQIVHYTEILDRLVDELGWTAGKVLEVADMGSGKGYLTFAAWQLLKGVRGLRPSVTGIEERGELAEASEAVARRLGCDGLRFRQGRISEVPLEGVQVLMALHACNTATDDALLRGVRAGADLILAAPCCHQQLRPQIDAASSPGPLGPLLRHGIMRERFSEWLTDGLRALYLEWAGYDTRVVEFVGCEHTPKNLLIVAIKKRRLIGPPDLKERIVEIKRLFGVERHAMDELLGAPAPA